MVRHTDGRTTIQTRSPEHITAMLRMYGAVIP